MLVVRGCRVGGFGCLVCFFRLSAGALFGLLKLFLCSVEEVSGLIGQMAFLGGGDGKVRFEVSRFFQFAVLFLVCLFV